MFDIRPVTDLRNNFTGISKRVHEKQSPIFLTKNGYGDMVVMSVESYAESMLQKRIDDALRRSSMEAKEDLRYSFKEVDAEMRKILNEGI